MSEKQKKAEILKKGLEAGTISKEEYEEKVKSLESDFPDKPAGKKEISEEIEPKSSDKILIIGIAAITLLFIAVFSYVVLNKETPKTIEELHEMNLRGELKPEQGYVYKGAYSFIKSDNVWFTQLKSPKGTRIYDLSLRYSPDEIKDIDIEGSLDGDFFNNKAEFYTTFNPLGREFSYVALATADFATHMSKVFEKNPVAACDRNETVPCTTRPIVTCDDKDKLVLYIKESERPRVYYNENCVVVEGKGFGLVKGVDRVLYNLYGIMEQEE